MAEVTGVGPTDPEGTGDDSVKAIQGNSQLLNFMEDSLEVQEEILEVLKSLKDQKDPVSSSGAADPLLDSIKNNTVALNNLTTKLENVTVDIAFHGLNSKFFERLVEVASDPNKVKSLELVADVFESMGKRLSKMGKYASGIDKFSASLYSLFGSVKELGKGMLMFSGGLALLGFTLVTFMEAITAEDLIKFAGIMLVVAGASRLVGKGSWSMAKASIGIATLGLAIWAFNELISTSVALDFVVSMGAIALGMSIMGLLGKKMGATTGILKGALAIGAIAGSVWLLNEAVSGFGEIDLIKAGKLALIAGGFGLVYKFMGSALPSILKGSVAAGAIGASLWLLGAGVNSLDNVDMTLGRGLELAGIIVATAGILTLIGNPVTIGFTLAGAAGAAAIGAALFVLAKGVDSIGSTKITPEQGKNFGLSLGYAIDALTSLANPLTVLALGMATPAALLLSGSTLAVSAAIYAVSKLPKIGTEQWDSFKYGMTSLTDIYSGFGLMEMAKMTAGSAAMTLVSGSSIVAAAAIWTFSKLSASPDSVKNAVSSLDNFITGVGTSFENNKGKFKMIKVGANSFFGLASMAGEIADTVQRISSMEFLEKKIVNGKLVTVGTRKFNSNDFKAVGSSIGEILNALTDPLSKIGGSSDEFNIGGFKVTNPFSNKVQKGIEAMAGIGSVFTPISDVINSFVNGNVNTSFVTDFNKNLALLIGGVGSAFDDDNIQIDKNKAKQIIRASGSVQSLMKIITRKTFGEGVGYFSSFSKDLNKVQKAINEINVEKLSSFNDMLFNMNELGKNDAIQHLVEVFTDFVEKLAQLESLRQQNQSTQQGESTPILTESTPTVQNKDNKAKEQSPLLTKELLSSSNEEVVEAITQLYEFLAGGNLKVTNKELKF